MLPQSLEDALQDPSIRRRRSGEVLLTLNALVLLQALRDFPDAWAPSSRMWVERALLYRRRMGGGNRDRGRHQERSGSHVGSPLK